MAGTLTIETRVPLSDGTTIPIFGLGCYLSDSQGEAEQACLHAIQDGYRLIDTAAFYDNEEDVGKAVRNCGVSRDQICVTTKLWYTDHGKKQATKAFHDSLARYVPYRPFIMCFVN